MSSNTEECTFLIFFLYIKINLLYRQSQGREGGEGIRLPHPPATADGSRPSAQPVLP